MEDGHEEMLLLKRSSRILWCHLPPWDPAQNLVSSSGGWAQGHQVGWEVAQRQGQEKPPKGLVLPLLLSRLWCCMKSWRLLLKFMEAISKRAQNTWIKVIFSLFILFQSYSATEHKPGTSESNKGHLKILMVKKKRHFCDHLSSSPVAVLGYLGLESFSVLYFMGVWFNFWDGYWQTEMALEIGIRNERKKKIKC